jgi:hypothetical protein
MAHGQYSVPELISEPVFELGSIAHAKGQYQILECLVVNYVYNTYGTETRLYPHSIENESSRTQQTNKQTTLGGHL